MPNKNSLRLLAALMPPSSYAFRAQPGEGADELHVVTRRKNIFIDAGRFPPESGEALVARRWAIWETAGPARRPRLSLTAAGKEAARLAAGPLEPARVLQGALEAVAGDEAGRSMIIDRAESPLVWLSRRRGKDGRPLLDPVAVEAGERLRRDITLARTLPNVTSRWDGMPGQSGGPSPGHVSDLVLAAAQRVERALAAVGPDLAGLLVDVCGFLKGLEQVEGERRWPRRSARIVLDVALAALARHYGLESAARGPERTGMRHWGTDDYRPGIG
ncbi:MAG: ATPase [Hyphomicrobiales bacterium]|nr:ATPase [Hyphomicrobiales bacterium]